MEKVNPFAVCICRSADEIDLSCSAIKMVDLGDGLAM